jgi:hypothetical protein
MSIFISVASYRDPHLQLTLKSAVENANNPAGLFFGIVNQDTARNEVDYSFLPDYSVIKMHPRNAKGVGYARSKAMSLYNGEDYFLQVDSHTQFSKDWDLKSIKQLKTAQEIAGHKKVIMSCYPGPYSLDNNQVFIHTISTEEHPVEPMKHIAKLRVDDQWSAIRVPMDSPNSERPELSNTVLGGYIFATGNIVNEIPYDEEISFMGEEICFAMRAWTRGWDIYSPSIPIVYHFYRRPGYPKVWSDDVVREQNWDQLQEISKEKQRKVLCGIEQGIMGAGSIRTIKDYEEFIGYDFEKIYNRLTNK